MDAEFWKFNLYAQNKIPLMFRSFSTCIPLCRYILDFLDWRAYRRTITGSNLWDKFYMKMHLIPILERHNHDISLAKCILYVTFWKTYINIFIHNILSIFINYSRFIVYHFILYKHKSLANWKYQFMIQNLLISFWILYEELTFKDIFA